MSNTFLTFPEKLLQRGWAAEKQTTDINHETQVMQTINTELLRICQLQRDLLDEQSAMIEEMLEKMGR